MSRISTAITISPGASRRWKYVTPLDRFEEKYIPEPNSGCWLWLGHLNPAGYGRFLINYRLVLAHRFSFQTFNGPLIEGMAIDHLCRTRSCVNPAHLEQVTNSENARRVPLKSTCKWGHEWTPENTWMNGTGRYCRACNNRRQRETQLRKRQSGLTS